ncbi:MAG: adenylate/guanylate cyclase domain-containing protein [Rhizobiales bacterium 62-47]|nr:adenylate/guanylate cyclase domain-containing protein [Hyphomicrobiales bacterium]OJY12752.1 MAG: adenylate/guanylate cyclase domain-containing protein [Rhizobiales bacterium 62-47]
MRQLRKLLRRFGQGRAIAVVVLLALVALRIADPPPIEELRVRTFDTFQLLQPRETTKRPVVIVDIDEKSLKEIGQWPWPRTRIADLVNQLARLSAGVVAFDIIFSERDHLSPSAAAQSFRDLDDATRARLHELPDNDRVMADAMRHVRTVLGESGLSAFVAPLDKSRPTLGIATIGGDPKPFLLNYPGLLRNIPTLDDAAAGRGLLSIRTERDGIVRRVPMIMQAQGLLLPSLTFEILRVVAQSDTIVIKADHAGVKSIAVPGLEIPTDRNGQLWVHFSHHNAARFVSAVDVLQGRIPPETVAGKLVLIGTSAVGLLDTKTTPTDPVMPGVEVHAQILEGVLTGSVLSNPNYAIVVELLAAGLIASTIIWLVPILGPLIILIVGALTALLLTGMSWYLFSQHHLLLDATFPLVASFAVYIVLVFTNYVSEEAQRRRIRSAFGQYLSPALVEQLAHSPERLVLGGEQRILTVMFLDVRGFTTISELYKDDPQGLISLMNRLLTPLTNAIINRKGTIDKYMGDAIMAFWNAPLDDPDHDANACNAALDILDCIETLNREREQEAQDSGTLFIPINVGIGLNTGSCVVGNIGSDLRFDYSALGDSVNLASRLEGQSKSYGLPIILGSTTARAVADRFATLELDYVKVKGKKEPELVYAIAGRKDFADSNQFQFLHDLNGEMLEGYRNRDWKAALSAIARSRVADHAGQFERYYSMYEARIASFEADPPPDDWQGVYTLLTK